MDHAIDLKIKLQVFSKYIGQKVWLENLCISENIQRHQTGTLTGIKGDAVQIRTGKAHHWITLNDEFRYHDVKLLLKPLSCLTEKIKDTANSLPVTVFITQYYVQLGFDMPVFISPGHPLNCKYAAEIGLADYRRPEDVLALNEQMQLAYTG